MADWDAIRSVARVGYASAIGALVVVLTLTIAAAPKYLQRFSGRLALAATFALLFFGALNAFARWRLNLASASPKPPLRCSFCNKGEAEARKLIAGPQVLICDECVDVCVGILADDRERHGPEHVVAGPANEPT